MTKLVDTVPAEDYTNINESIKNLKTLVGMSKQDLTQFINNVLQ